MTEDPARSAMNGALSGMRGVIRGVGIGVLAAKKAGPLAKKANSLLTGALSKYVASHATDQVPSTDQAAGGSPAT